MPSVVGDDHACPNRASDFGDVGVIDATPRNAIPGRRLQHRQSIGLRQIVNRHPREDFFLE